MKDYERCPGCGRIERTSTWACRYEGEWEPVPSEDMIQRAMRAVPPSPEWEWTESGRRMIAEAVLNAVFTAPATDPRPPIELP